MAAGILRRGTESLSKVSSHGEREFHKALSNLRQRWRLRRTPQGTIVGDLSYLSGNWVIRSLRQDSTMMVVRTLHTLFF